MNANEHIEAGEDWTAVADRWVSQQQYEKAAACAALATAHFAAARAAAEVPDAEK